MHTIGPVGTGDLRGREFGQRDLLVGLASLGTILGVLSVELFVVAHLGLFFPL